MYSFLLFSLFNAALVCGMIFGTDFKAKSIHKENPKIIEIDFNKSVVIAVGLVMIIAYAIYIYYGVLNIRSLAQLQAVTAQRFNSFSELRSILYTIAILRVLYFMFSLTVPFLSARFFIATGLVLFIMLASGARLNLFAVILGIGLIAALRGYKFSMYLGFAVLPMIGIFSLLTRFFLRAFTHQSSLMDLVQFMGGWSEILTNPLELHYYRTITSIISLDMHSSIDRYPGESVLAALTLPIPRSIFTLKPTAASSAYTAFIDPIGWERFQSQATIGVFGDAYLEMGALAACVFIFITGYIYASLAKSCIQKYNLTSLTILFSLLVSTIIYFRTGITQLGLIFWPTVSVLFLVKLGSSILPNFQRRNAN